MKPAIVHTFVAASLLALSGCGSAINDGVGPETTVPSISGGGPNNTGTYPNLNIRPTAANKQLTDKERESVTSGLASSASAAQAGVSQPGISPSDAERLKKMREEQEAIRKQIETGQ